MYTFYQVYVEIPELERGLRPKNQPPYYYATPLLLWYGPVYDERGHVVEETWYWVPPELLQRGERVGIVLFSRRGRNQCFEPDSWECLSIRDAAKEVRKRMPRMTDWPIEAPVNPSGEKVTTEFKRNIPWGRIAALVTALNTAILFLARTVGVL